MALSILFGKENPGQIGELVLDATLSDSHSYVNEVTQHPIETGANISDHIKLNPDQVTIEGFVTNSPVAFIQFTSFGLVRRESDGQLRAKNLSGTTQGGRVKSAYITLLELSGRQIDGPNKEPKIIDVVTGLRIYRNMAITDLSIPRDSANSKNQLRFRAVLTSIKTVTSETIELPNVSEDIKDSAQSKTDTAKQTAKTPTAKQEEKSSTAYKLAKGIQGLF